jgi:hypothetical protein
VDFKVGAGRGMNDVEVKYDVKSTLGWDMQKTKKAIGF